jgi:O-antigen/teichoic acid export membrane protein
MSLRARALRGGAYLSIREGVGIGIRLAGTLVVTRLIGPTDYGLYAGALAAVAFLGIVAQMGVGVYVIRLEEEPTKEIYDVTFTVVTVTGLAIMLLGLAVSFAIPASVVSPSHIAPFQVLILALPLNVLWTPAQAKLERNLQYRRMAWIEVGGDVVLCVVPITLAVLGAGVWAPVAGYVAWQAWLLLASCAAARYRPRLLRRREVAREMVRYGLGYSSATWIYQARELSGPVIVGTLLGPKALGYTALAVRITETLCFAARATWRLSIAVFGRLQADLGRLAVALSEAMALQVVALGPILGGFALLATVLVPAIFGEVWRPTVELLPFVFVAYLLTSTFNMEASLLYVRKENRVMILTNVVRIAILFGVGFALVPAIGTLGWAVAMAVHPLGFAPCVRRVDRILEVRYRPIVFWLIAALPPLFAPYLSWPLSAVLLVPTAVVFSTRWARAELRVYAEYLRSALRRSRAEGKPSPTAA